MTCNRMFLRNCGFLLAGAVAAAQIPAPVPAPAPPAPLAQPPQAPQTPQPAQPALPSPFGLDFSADMARINAEMARASAQLAQINLGADPGFAFHTESGNASRDDRLYANGQRALDRSQWDEALEAFTRVAANGGSRADGALYWKAYALDKLGRRDEAAAALADLRKSYANSRWLNDASALEIEIKQAAGQNVSPESQPDDELKLMALNALVHSDPDRALPLLENLLKSAQSPRLKERALFVLAQSDAPRAQQLLEQVARGSANPDLQLTAINYMGAALRKKGNNQILVDIYNSSSDVNVKRAALNMLAATGNADQLLQVVKTEKSPELRAEAVRRLFSRPETGDALVSLYASDLDKQVKGAIADTLFAQRNAKALVDLARKETDSAMKRDLVRRLSSMQSKEATDYLMELLK